MLTLLFCKYITAISPKVLNSYKDIITNITYNLKIYLQDIQKKINYLKARDTTAINKIVLEQHIIIEEKESIKHSLNIYTYLSAQINKFKVALAKSTQYIGRPSAYKHIKTSLN